MATEIKPGLDGLYAVCFNNDKGYTEAKIWEIFQRYGRVLSVRFSGPENRKLVFVRYKEYNETKQCLDDLNKSNELSVRMAIPSKKLPYNRISNFSGDKTSGSGCNTFKKPYHKNFRYGNEQIRNADTKQENCHIENENSSKNFEGTTQNGEVSNNEDLVDDRTLNRFTGLQLDYNMQGIGDDGPPPLVDSEDLPHHLDQETVVYATDVIVANLPPTVDEWDVVCLARKHDLNPVHVSAVERTGLKYNIPFCHLWMENDDEAEIAELVLRGIYLEGKALLVARAEVLLSGFHDGPTTLATA